MNMMTAAGIQIHQLICKNRLMGLTNIQIVITNVVKVKLIYIWQSD